ncbi:ELMO domain-containing protein 1 [Clonorchis sinensis]|uniref:ELMO domain-containing protein 1 n=1 Tax=Clonorchis sinensis TaxID=79923 RepID=G7Y3H6_CLOSI|nr:ELMO domain-containing protein 1 [Clonorchis sinensis]
MLYVFLEKGQLKNQFYNTADQCNLEDFHKLFCFTFHSFHEYWMKTVRDVMFFNFHREQFRSRLESRLQSSDCRLGLPGSNGDVSFFEP